MRSIHEVIVDIRELQSCPQQLRADLNRFEEQLQYLPPEVSNGLIPWAKSGTTVHRYVANLVQRHVPADRENPLSLQIAAAFQA